MQNENFLCIILDLNEIILVEAFYFLDLNITKI